MKKTILLLTTLVMAWTSQGWGQIAAWDVNGLTSYGTSPFSATSKNANITVGGLTRGAGITTSGTAASNAWGGNGMDEATLAGAIAQGDTVSFNIKPNVGYTLNLSSIHIKNIRRSGTGPNTMVLQYALNGGTYKTVRTYDPIGATTAAAGNNQSEVSLVDEEELQNISSDDNVFFRLAVFGGTGGTWYINNVTGDDITISGTVTELSTVTLANTGSPSEGNITSNTNDVVLFGFSYTPSAFAPADGISFTALDVTTSGTVTTDDVSNFRLVVDVNNNGVFDGGEDVIATVASLSSTLSFSSFSPAQTDVAAARRYLLVADVAEEATPGHHITASIANSSAITTTADLIVGTPVSGNQLTIISADSPQITADPETLTAFGNVVQNQVSDSQTLTVNATNLTENVIVTAPAGFQVSLEEDENYSSSVEVEHTGGTIEGVTVYVRFAPTSAVGAQSGDVMMSSDGADDVEISVSGNALASEPTTASTVSFGDIGFTSIVVNFTGGNGGNRIVVVKAGEAVDATPADATTYTANAAYGSGDDLGDGNYVVYNGDGNTVTVTGLTDGVTYHFAVFEYNVGTGSSQNYLATSGVGNTTTNSIFEKFESGSKGAFTTASVTLASGNWTFNDALIGTLANDKKNGAQSARIQGSGFIEMQFDISGGVGNLIYEYAHYGTDGTATVEAFYSINQGASWVSLGTQTTGASLQTANLAVNVLSPVRFRIGKTGGTRVNIDDVNYTTTTTGTSHRQIAGSAGWRMLSAPVANMPISQLTNRTAIQGFGDGFDKNFYTGWSGAAWSSPENLSGNLSSGNGFILYFFNNNNFGSSELPITLTATGTEPASDVTVNLNTTGDNWTLVGNPFASNIDLLEITQNGGKLVSDVFSTWNNATSSYVTSSTNGNRLAAWQGAFVENDNATSITIPTSAKVTTSTNFYKAAEPAYMVLKLAGESATGITSNDEANVLYFHPLGERGWDRLDATKLFPLVGNVATLGFHGERRGEAVRKSQDSRSIELTESEVFLMDFFTHNMDGEFTITWAEQVNLPSDWNFYFEDLHTGEMFCMKERESYSFSHVMAGKASFVNEIRPLATSVAATEEGPRFKITVTRDVITSNERDVNVPHSLELSQNYPNPFNPNTQISFALPQNSEVKLEVYNMLGQRVAVLVNEMRPAGSHTALFDARGLASGVYLYRLQVGSQVLTKKMTLLK